VISTGFPGTVASLRQQWGRAGRRGHGLAVLVASEDALDQYFMREPAGSLRIEPVGRKAVDQLGRLAALGEADRSQVTADESRE